MKSNLVTGEVTKPASMAGVAAAHPHKKAYASIIFMILLLLVFVLANAIRHKDVPVGSAPALDNLPDKAAISESAAADKTDDNGAPVGGNLPSTVAATDETTASGDFAGCTVLHENCLRKDKCELASFCGEDVAVCRIYDCGDNYGVYEQENGGGTMTYQQEKKISTAADEAGADAQYCSGRMQVLDEQCTDKGKLEIKLKYSAMGECKIAGFDIGVDGAKKVPNTFTKESDGAYHIVLDKCGQVDEITPRTK
jgi:hypothetical protein